MQHVGKIYPLLTPGYDFWLFLEGYLPSQYGIPRCWQMQNSDTPSGTLAQKWANLLVVSLPGTIANNRQSITWRFNHPTDSLAYVTWQMSWEQYRANENWPDSNFRYIYRARYFDLGVVHANGIWLRWEQPNQWHNTIATTVFELFQVPWPGATNHALFRDMGSTKMASSSWAQQQATYHPYRH